jgi:hypothetical protein
LATNSAKSDDARLICQKMADLPESGKVPLENAKRAIRVTRIKRKWIMSEAQKAALAKAQELSRFGVKRPHPALESIARPLAGSCVPLDERLVRILTKRGAARGQGHFARCGGLVSRRRPAKEGFYRA